MQENKPSPKFVIGESVDVAGWGSTTHGAVIIDIDWVFHNRLEAWTWGYKLDRATGFAMTYVPETYIRKIQTGAL